MIFPVINLKKTGKRIKELCKKEKLSPQSIKNKLNLSCVQTVYKWFQGENLPSIENFYALSLLLGISMEDMLVFKVVKPVELKLEHRIVHIEKNSSNTERLCLYWNYLGKC